MKLDLSDKDIELLQCAFEDLMISLLAEAPNVKASDSKIYKQYAVDLGLLLKKIEEQTEVEE